MQITPDSGLRVRQKLAQHNSDRFMWITPDRVFYVGLLGAPSDRTMGSVIVYVAVEGAIRVSIAGGEWQVAEMAVVQPFVRHRIESECRFINVIKVEAETVDLSALPELLRNSGAVDAPCFVERMRRWQRELCDRRCDIDLTSLDFDEVFFDAPLPTRKVDRRIKTVIDRIKSDPSGASTADECAEMTHLSFSRFLHLFKHELGVPFRSFRSWKRARSLLYYVCQDANLAHVALDAGYPDSTHFSHSIRQVYGLKPRDIFAGSRRLAVFAHS